MMKEPTAPKHTSQEAGRTASKLWLQIMGEMSHEHRVERTVKLPSDSWLGKHLTRPR